MSENTNTPNGDSKNVDLYSQNPDKNGIQVVYMALKVNEKEKDKEKENEENIVVLESESGFINTKLIEKYGFITVGAKECTPKIKEALFKIAEKSKIEHDKNISDSLEK